MAEEPLKIGRRTTRFSKAESGKYNINNLCYPEDISTRDDMQHYISFFINVRQSSKFNKGSRIGIVTNEGQARTDPQSGEVQDELRSDALSAAAGISGGALSGAAVTAIASKVFNASGANIIGKLGIVGGVTGAGLGIGTAKYGGTFGGGTGAIWQPEKLERISDVITLAVQASPSANYSVGWETGSLGSFMGSVFAGGSGAVENSANALNIASDMARRIGETLAQAPTALTAMDQVQTYIESSTKRVANPQKEQLFKSVGFRQFSFAYTFMPKSESETWAVKNIINTFKLHMYPELSASGIYFIYPSEFDIQYYYKGVENEFINKISSCALTDMVVDYGGDNFSTFPDGSPTMYNLKLTFTELETLTKERISEGY